MIDDLLGEIEEVCNSSTIVEKLLEDILCANYNTLEQLENKYHCKIGFSKEKHHTLQYTEYYSISSPLVNTELHIEVENGINNGTQLIGYSFVASCIPTHRIAEVLVGIELDEPRYEFSRFSVDKARLVLPHHTKDIMKLLAQQSYDDYFTGGGTVKTNSYYKEKFDRYEEMGLFWKAVYEEKEVDVNIM